jgi:hypothetical protein
LKAKTAVRISMALIFLLGVGGFGSASAARPAQVDPTSLAPPTSAWTDFTLTENGPVDAVGAGSGPFANNHTSTYQALGMQTGYQRGGTWPKFESIHYLASVYGSASSAASALRDGQSHTAGIAGSQSQTCMPFGLPSSCAEFVYPATSGLQVTYVAVRVGECLIEVQGYPPADISPRHMMVSI